MCVCVYVYVHISGRRLVLQMMAEQRAPFEDVAVQNRFHQQSTFPSEVNLHGAIYLKSLKLSKYGHVTRGYLGERNHRCPPCGIVDVEKVARPL